MGMGMVKEPACLGRISAAISRDLALVLDPRDENSAHLGRDLARSRAISRDLALVLEPRDENSDEPKYHRTTTPAVVQKAQCSTCSGGN